ncbi:MAG: NAD(+) synthase [Candidatus Heimdallarchaeota archaeon]
MKELDIKSNIDQFVGKIIDFIGNAVEERKYEGVLIWFSGFIDSTVITKLSLETLDEDKIKILLRAEKFYDDYDKICKSSLDYLGIKKKNIEECDVDELLDKFGSGPLVEGSIRQIPLVSTRLSYSFLKGASLGEIMDKTYGFVGKASSGRDELLNRIIAHNKLSSRIQMASAYLIAETENRLLISTLNKTELMTGLFTKFGRGQCADIMPLGHLYRSQILQLAEFLDVPEIIRSAAKVDLLPGVENKYLYFFNLPAYDVDKVLVLLETGRSVQDIQSELNLSIEEIERISTFVASSAYSRGVPLIIE